MNVIIIEREICIVRVAPIVEKMVESRFRWFVHVGRRPIDSAVRKVQYIRWRIGQLLGAEEDQEKLYDKLSNLKLNGLDKNITS